MLVLFGGNALSAFRIEALISDCRKLSPGLGQLAARNIYFVDGEVTTDTADKLAACSMPLQAMLLIRILLLFHVRALFHRGHPRRLTLLTIVVCPVCGVLSVGLPGLSMGN